MSALVRIYGHLVHESLLLTSIVGLFVLGVAGWCLVSYYCFGTRRQEQGCDIRIELQTGRPSIHDVWIEPQNAEKTLYCWDDTKVRNNTSENVDYWQLLDCISIERIFCGQPHLKDLRNCSSSRDGQHLHPDSHARSAFRCFTALLWGSLCPAAPRAASYRASYTPVWTHTRSSAYQIDKSTSRVHIYTSYTIK